MTYGLVGKEDDLELDVVPEMTLGVDLELDDEEELLLIVGADLTGVLALGVDLTEVEGRDLTLDERGELDRVDGRV